MKKQGISEKSIIVWRIRATLVLFAAAFILGALFVFLPILSSIIGTLCGIVYILAILIYYPWLYRSTGYILGDREISITRGCFVKRKCTLRSTRVQYVVTITGPIQKIFGLCSLSFMTAGSTEILQNITIENAEKIRECLKPVKEERCETKKAKKS